MNVEIKIKIDFWMEFVSQLNIYSLDFYYLSILLHQACKLKKHQGWCLKDNLESPAKFFPGLKKAIFNDFQERQRLCTVCSNLGSRNLSWWIRGHRVPLNGQNNSIIRQIFVYDTEVFINIYSGIQLFYSNMKKAHTWQYIPSKIPWKIKKAGPS